jgi:hypothetical protein
LVPPTTSHSPKQKIRRSATPELNTPSVLSVGSDCAKISGLYFSPAGGVVGDHQAGEGSGAAGQRDPKMTMNMARNSVPLSGESTR